MKALLYTTVILFFIPFFGNAQNIVNPVTNKEMVFISDTQQPMWVEKLVLKSTHNIKATSQLFASIIKLNPINVYMLGDIVSLGYSNHKWKKVDQFLKDCRKENTSVCGLLKP